MKFNFLDKIGLNYLVEKVQEELNKKITAVEGKGLSSNDLTNELLNTFNEKVGTEQISNLFKDVSYTASNGVISFTLYDGTEKNIDLPLELLIDTSANNRYEPTTKEIILVLADGAELKIPVNDLVNNYVGDGNTIDVIENEISISENVVEIINSKFDESNKEVITNYFMPSETMADITESTFTVPEDGYIYMKGAVIDTTSSVSYNNSKLNYNSNTSYDSKGTVNNSKGFIRAIDKNGMYLFSATDNSGGILVGYVPVAKDNIITFTSSNVTDVEKRFVFCQGTKPVIE